MTSREHMAVSIAPLFLRLALSITFIWAGLGKMLADMPVRGERAAVLANMDVGVVQRAAQRGNSPPAPAPTPVPAKEQPKPSAKTPASGPPALVVLAQSTAG
ncbi:MAG: hypothetical protein JNK16_01900, partial [Phycisphaerales bacterium]|nr:hypothetical protein [Phycisphaerales bacterium]